jgi:hypothetical protein
MELRHLRYFVAVGQALKERRGLVMFVAELD